MDILFAVLPFTDAEHPAIGVSLLQAQLKSSGFCSTIRYFNLDLAEQIGSELYNWLALCDPDPLGTSAPAVSMTGEWFFADLVFGGQIPHEDEYIARFLSATASGQKLIPQILEARSRRREFIDQCVSDIQEHSSRVVGFTTSFHQTCASLAVAARLKESENPPIIIFGGANCSGEMGLQMIRSFPCVDYVCTGEADEALPCFLQRLLCDGDPRAVPGILKRGEEDPSDQPALVSKMDALPFPDYSDYFQKLRGSRLEGRIKPRLLIETSRGCWWGEKYHCTFCGLNGETMAYRSKSPDRVLRELSHLCKTYDLDRFDCVDNILDPRYIHTIFPELIENGPKLELFYATKSNLSFEQLSLLREGGVRTIQPGIESFSNQVLRLMRKGCTALQNIQLLRWCQELGISVCWNILYGFPGESPSEYKHMAELIPLLTHLQPPAFCETARADRFSPMFASPERYGLVHRRPAPAYSYVYPLERKALENLAYFFEFDYSDDRQPENYVKELVREVEAWALQHRQRCAQLDLFQAREVVLINDTRLCALKRNHVLSGLAAKVYQLCDTPQTGGSLVLKLGSSVNDSEIRALLAKFMAAKLMIESEGRYLSLAVMRIPDRSVHERRLHDKHRYCDHSEGLCLLREPSSRRNVSTYGRWGEKVALHMRRTGLSP
jgi:ribosomal peptide maturation radical SAM protein 1